MQAKTHCQHCQTELPEGVPGNRCPKCLLELGLTDLLEAEDSPAPFAAQRFGDYELLEEIARGGMGVVFKARQLKLNRVVALKLILSGQFATKQEVLRFRSEAEAAANLRHPNIVAIHETGEARGQHFFSMDYVPRRNLAEIVRDEPLPAKRAARYVEVIARAIHYAHQQGILHRDLKPSNVLIDADDQPRITDFGLAKRLRGDHGITVTGQTLGSPNFMPPEQTSGRSKDIGPPSDVYGIGAILYHALTGRPPFQAATLEEVLRAVHEKEPVLPRLLNASLPRDLETICLKCLEKDPAKRYATGLELAEELERFSRDEPIRARPVGPAEKLWRWCRRHPAMALVSGALLVAVLAGASGIVWQWRRATRNAVALRHGLYAADVNLAWHVRAEKNLSRARELLLRHQPKPGDEDLRGFEWRYLWSLCQSQEAASITAHDAEVSAVAVTPDGAWLLTMGYDRSVKLWDLRTHEFKSTLLKLAGRPPNHGLAASSDGKLAAASDGFTVTIWETSNWQQKKVLNEFALGFTFLPISGSLATTSGDGLRVWDANSWQARNVVTGALEMFACNPDETLLAVARKEELQLCDASTGALVATLPGRIQDHAYSLTFSPDGRCVAAGGMDGGVTVWDVPSRQVITNIAPHKSFAQASRFSPDGRWFATGGGDHFLTLWSTATWRQEAELFGHANGIWGLTFTPDSRELVSSSRDHTVKFWTLPPPRSEQRLGDAQGIIGFLPDSRSAVTLDKNGVLRVWETDTRRETQRHTLGQDQLATGGAVSPDGHVVAVGYDDGTVELRRLRSGELLQQDRGGTNSIFWLRFSPDGKTLASIGISMKAAPSPLGTITLWEVAPWKKLTALGEAVGGRAGAVDFSHDGRTIAVATPEHSILLWDRTSNRPVRTLKGHTWDVSATMFSPDDQTLASSSWDTTVRLWNVETGREKGQLHGLLVAAESVVFSPDGRTLSAVASGREIHLWHLWNQQELLTLEWKGMFGGGLYFSSDGMTLGMGRLLPISPDGGVQLWRAPLPNEAESSGAFSKRPR
jgi:WD40 repeat protein/tRNA A-37 threonylcarbamoyl transferase component Bud32